MQHIKNLISLTSPKNIKTLARSIVVTLWKVGSRLVTGLSGHVFAICVICKDKAMMTFRTDMTRKKRLSYFASLGFVQTLILVSQQS